jgi:hypothetical protein
MKIYRLFGFLSCFLLSSFLVANAQQVMAVGARQDVVRHIEQHGIPKTTTKQLTFPFFDDFVSSGLFADTSKWVGSDTYVGNSIPVNPPSYNVAIFDSYDKYGRVYQPDSNGFIGDTLQSHSFDLSGISATDSVFLSFYYQVGGKPSLNTLNPDSLITYDTNEVDGGIEIDTIVTYFDTRGYVIMSEQDSFLLEFYHADSGQWERIAAYTEIKLNPEFEGVAIYVPNEYRSTNFMFRFINKLQYNVVKQNLFSLKASWLLDYVKLDYTQLESNDFAITNTPQFLFNDNSYSIPWKHLQQIEEDIYRSRIEIPMRKNASINLNIDRVEYEINELIRGENIAFDERASLGILLSELIDTIEFETNFTSMRNFSQDKGKIEFKTVVTPELGADEIADNNSFTHVFECSNYYAYDDGTPEFVLNDGDRESFVATRFYSHVPDTLRAIDIYFERAIDGATEGVGFELWVWAMDKDSLPDLSIDPIFVSSHTDSVKYRSEYGFYRYAIDAEDPVIIDKYFFIGIKQYFDNELGIGIDMSNDSQNAYSLYEAGPQATWNPLSIPGTLMMRPVVGEYFEVVSSNQIFEDTELVVYPQPVSDILYIEIPDSWFGDYEVSMYNLLGQKVKSSLNTSEINVSDLEAGTYLLNINNGSTVSKTTKIVVTP